MDKVFWKAAAGNRGKQGAMMYFRFDPSDEWGKMEMSQRISPGMDFPCVRNSKAGDEDLKKNEYRRPMLAVLWTEMNVILNAERKGSS